MRIITIDAPSTLGVTTQGIDQAPRALKSALLLERIGAREGPMVPIPPYNNQRDPEILLLNPYYFQSRF